MSDSEEDPVAEVQNQLNSLQVQGNNDDDDEELPQAIINRLVALKQIHIEVDTVNLEYKKERAALEKKYDTLRAPLLEKRKSVVVGEIDVQLEDTETGSEIRDEEEKVVEKGIPGFWYQCIANHPTVGSLVSEDDVGALEALTNISVQFNDEYSGFKLTFSFRENDYFTNTELCKTYSVAPDLLEDKAPALTSVDGTKIDWKSKKNLCVTEVKKKQKAKSGRKAGQVRFITKLEPKPSFFHFFGEPRLDDEDDEEEDEEGEGGHKEGEHEYQLSIDEDYEAGHAFRAEIIPDAILWYTGEALDERDEDEDLPDDEEDEDDEDEDEEEEGPASSSVPAGEQPECKQS